MKATLAAAIFLFPTLCAPAARAMSAEEQKAVETGLNALYRLDFDAGERVFVEALKASPHDPVYSLGVASALWWRLENDFVPPDSPEEKTFQAALDRAIADAKDAARGEHEAEGNLYLGAAYGLRARREAAQHRWFAAYRDGRRAYRSEKKALKLDPELADADLGVGAFDYYVATLSRFVRFFAFSAGDKAKGLAELRFAAERGKFGAVAAKLVLAGIDWTFEKKPEEAAAIVDDLLKRYPDSPLMETMRLIALFHLRDAEGLKREAKAYLERGERGAPNFRPVDRTAGIYFLGLGEQLSGEYPQAMKEYEEALRSVPEKHPWRSMLRLFIGECWDLQGKREAAVASYRRALAERPLWGVPRYANYLLKRPFRPGDNPLPARSDDLP